MINTKILFLSIWLDIVSISVLLVAESALIAFTTRFLLSEDERHLVFPGP